MYLGYCSKLPTPKHQGQQQSQQIKSSFTEFFSKHSIALIIDATQYNTVTQSVSSHLNIHNNVPVKAPKIEKNHLLAEIIQKKTLINILKQLLCIFEKAVLFIIFYASLVTDWPHTSLLFISFCWSGVVPIGGCFPRSKKQLTNKSFLNS